MFLLLLLFANKNLHQGLRRGNHRIGGDAELFVDSRGRGGGAEAISADGFDRVFSPAKGGGSFDGDSALAVGRDERRCLAMRPALTEWMRQRERAGFLVPLIVGFPPMV